MSEQELFEEMKQTVMDGDVVRAEALARQSLDLGIEPLRSINQGFKIGLDVIGQGFEEGEYYLPDLVLAGKVMDAAMDILKDAMETEASTDQSLGKVLIATVEGDVHTIGKDLVALMLKLNGFEVINLGHDVPTVTIVEKTMEEKPDILGLSALLTTTTQAQRDIIEALEDIGLRDDVRVMIGGAATSSEWAEVIGADGYAEDATSAVKKAKVILEREAA
jgi:corrinoid protein of di/trimethylamine methyltransferase